MIAVQLAVQAKRRPDDVAVVYGQRRLSYAELLRPVRPHGAGSGRAGYQAGRSRRHPAAQLPAFLRRPVRLRHARRHLRADQLQAGACRGRPGDGVLRSFAAAGWRVVCRSARRAQAAVRLSQASTVDRRPTAGIVGACRSRLRALAGRLRRARAAGGARDRRAVDADALVGHDRAAQGHRLYARHGAGLFGREDDRLLAHARRHHGGLRAAVPRRTADGPGAAAAAARRAGGAGRVTPVRPAAADGGHRGAPRHGDPDLPDDAQARAGHPRRPGPGPEQPAADHHRRRGAPR